MKCFRGGVRSSVLVWKLSYWLLLIGSISLCTESNGQHLSSPALRVDGMPSNFAQPRFLHLGVHLHNACFSGMEVDGLYWVQRGLYMTIVLAVKIGDWTGY